MKQKRINNILYVFQTTPYVITEDTDAQIIKVQEESYPGFKELNESLADKIVKYNYKVVCITQQEWMPYINQPDPEPQNYTLKLVTNLSNDRIRIDLNGTEKIMWEFINEGKPVAEGTLIEVYLLTENESDYDTTSISTWMTLSTEGGLHYYANMPSEDKTITINRAIQA